MPPKCKFTREEVIESAFNIARTSGFDAITARALGERLGSSTRPVFSLFRSMDEVLAEVKTSARALYDTYIARGLQQTDMPAFKGVGTGYIRFASEEPKLFQLLFMREQEEKPPLSGILPVIDDNYEQILASVQNLYHLGPELSLRFYRHLWVYTHGIAALCATGMCTFTGEEISRMLTEVCTALLKSMRSDSTKPENIKSE